MTRSPWIQYVAATGLLFSIACGDQDEPLVAPLPQAVSTGAQEELGDAADGRGPRPHVRDVRVLPAIPADVRSDVQRVRGAGGVHAPPPPSPTELVLDKARGLKPDEPMDIVIALEERPFDPDTLRVASDAARTALIAARQADLKGPQDALQARLQAIGARNVSPRWLVNHVAATVAARHVPALAGWPGVTAVLLDSKTGGAGLAYSGVEGRAGLLTNAFLARGYEGNARGRAGGAVRIGVIEWHESGTNWLARNHVGWRDWSGGPSRIGAVYDCRSGSCSTTTADATSSTHGTSVSSIALGSIEQGQDPAFTGAGTTDQIRRSGQAREAELYYYMIDGCSELAAALQRAVADGVDVANYSGWVQSQSCDQTLNCGGINDTVRSAMDAGLLFVACAGNSGHAGSCSLWYPGWRSDVLAVNALDSGSSASNYNGLALAGFASQGPLPIRRHDGLTGLTTAGLGLCAPGIWNYNYTTASNYNLGGAIAGCSFASPAVAGAAGLLREALNAIGWAGNNARALMVNLLVLGDTWEHLNGSDLRTQVSDYSGYGRLHMHWPSSDNLTAPWGWGWRSFTIQNGQTVSWTVWDAGAESPLVRQWKWAFTWFENDLNNVADIVIKVVNTCPSGGGEVTVASDYSYDLRKRIHLGQAEISGRCLEMRAYGWKVPAGGRVVYSADYFHAGDPAQH
jgi:hypothetical protein